MSFTHPVSSSLPQDISSAFLPVVQHPFFTVHMFQSSRVKMYSPADILLTGKENSEKFIPLSIFAVDFPHLESDLDPFWPSFWSSSKISVADAARLRLGCCLLLATPSSSCKAFESVAPQFNIFHKCAWTLRFLL